jgi:hypothetical protein
VLAVELQQAREQTRSLVAVATIVAAQLAQVLGSVWLEDHLPRAQRAASGDAPYV